MANMVIKNIVEDVVNVLIDQVMLEVGVCDCTRCRMDVAALALNELKPRYVVTEFGELMENVSCYDAQNRLDIYRALLRASIRVKAQPFH